MQSSFRAFSLKPEKKHERLDSPRGKSSKSYSRQLLFLVSRQRKVIIQEK